MYRQNSLIQLRTINLRHDFRLDSTMRQIEGTVNINEATVHLRTVMLI